MRSLLTPAVAVVVFAFSHGVSHADDLSIESYEFEWKVVKVGDAALSVIKDPDKTKISLRTNIGSLSLSGEEAEDLAKGMSKTSEMAKKMKGTAGKSETSKIGQVSVQFLTTKDGTFYVRVSRADDAFDSLMLNREEAAAFVPHLKKAKAMIALVDKKINP